MSSEGELVKIDLALLERKLAMAKTNLEKEYALKLELSKENPDEFLEYLCILKSKLGNIGECEQSLACPSGLASVTKKVLLSAVTSQPKFVDIINNLDSLEGRKIRDIINSLNQELGQLTSSLDETEMKEDLSLMWNIVSRI